MSELRLVPVALLVWCIALSIVLSRQPWIGLLLLLLGVGGASVFRAFGHAIVSASLGALGVVTAYWRVRQADSFSFKGQLAGTVASAATRTKTGSWFVQLDIPGFPGTVPALLTNEPPPIGSQIVIHAQTMRAERASLSPVILKARQVHDIAAADGAAGWANSIKAHFADAVTHVVGPSSEGLLPGMVLGDTSLQSTAERQLYLDTGLSHLSAVSGANVAIITTAAVLLARVCSQGPRVQIGVAACALVVFVLLVGLEPSVLRASVTGVVGMLAVVGSAQAEPMHGLAIAVISLVLWDTSLAVNFGFALSVAATAGIVVLFPLLYRAIANRFIPDIVSRALAVSVAADVVTMPLVALMSGKIATVSVLANVLVAPAVAPVTILGLIAVLLNLFPGNSEVVPLKLAEPCTWWINVVAQHLSSWEHSTVGMPVAASILLAGWIVWLIHTRTWWVFALLPLAALPALVPTIFERTPELRPDPARIVHLQTIPDDYRAPPNTQVIVVWEEGKPSTRGHVSREGIPVIYPSRDPQVRLLIDGRQLLEQP